MQYLGYTSQGYSEAQHGRILCVLHALTEYLNANGFILYIDVILQAQAFNW